MANELVDSQEIYNEGIDLIDEGEYEAALKLGERLERIRWTGGFALQAIAYEHLDRLEDAVKTLQRGVEAAGGPWSLYSRLGNYLSDMERYEEALEAYDKGLALEDTDVLLFSLNRAIVFWRQNAPEKALQELNLVYDQAEEQGSDASIYWRFKAQYADIVRDLEKIEEYLKIIDDLEIDIFDNDDFAEDKSRLCSGYAQYNLEHEKQDSMQKWLDRSIDLDPTNTVAHWIVRAKNKEHVPAGGTYFRIILEGIWPASLSGEGLDLGFFTTVDCIANTADHALAYARPFFPKEARASLTIDEIKILEAHSDDPQGLYRFTGYNLFNPDVDEDED